MTLFRKSLGYDIARRVEYAKNENLIKYGVQLTDKDYWDHRIELKFATRFCKTHASYVLKDHPNINVPPIASDVPTLRQQASYVERVLNTWWKEQDITNKYKTGLFEASYKGDYIWYLSVDTKRQEISFNQLKPDFFTYDRATSDPTSPIIWVLRAELMNCDILKEKYPKHSQSIQPSGMNTRFTSFQNFYRSDLFNMEKAVFMEYMDLTHIYRYVNDVEVEVFEHNLPFITYYPFKYFDIGDKWGQSILTFIKDPIKFLNQLVGYQFDMALKSSNPPLVIIGGNANIDWDARNGGKISIPTIAGWTASVQYLSPPQANIQTEKMIEMMRAFMHFLGWLNEEAMAGFTWALTAAGVSIELRMDATVREALDVQLKLQSLMEKINRDYLKLTKKFFPNKDLFLSEELGRVFDVPFTGTMIGECFNNVVDFGGILPRSNTEIVRNVLAKHQAGLISQDTALEELRYRDPTIEIKKIEREQIEKAKQQKILQQGGIPEQVFFNTPKEEENYIYTENKIPTPHPSQNFAEHRASHMKAYENSPHPLLMQHMLIEASMEKEVGQGLNMPVRNSEQPQNFEQNPQQNFQQNPQQTYQ